ncbi:hypothetical protein KAS31_00120 [Candidatus Parcubacteria bacterium]|nr:hypothetical protein [Candidatus Parcubacteria bacterium]
MFVGIPLLCIVILLVETVSTLAGVIIFIVGALMISEGFWIFSSMSMSDWIFECNSEGNFPKIYHPKTIRS